MDDSKAENNKATVQEAFDTLFNKRDYAAAERFLHSTKPIFQNESRRLPVAPTRGAGVEVPAWLR
jgi:hypothetical protein